MAPKKGSSPSKTTPQKEAGTPATPATTPPSTGKKKKKENPCVRATKAHLSLTGPINICLFFPGVMIYQHIAKEGWGGIKPLFAASLFPLEEFTAAVAAILADRQSLVLNGVLLAFTLLCLFFGISLLRTTMGLFDEANGTIDAKDPPLTLITAGPYRYVRNPMSLAMLMLLLAEGLLFGVPMVMGLVFMYVIFLLIYTCCSEEPDLKTRFGVAWVTYSLNVPAWCPRCSPYEPGREQV